MAKIKRLPNKSQFYIQKPAPVSKFTLNDNAVSNQECNLDEDMDEEMTVEDAVSQENFTRVCSDDTQSTNITDESTNHGSNKVQSPDNFFSSAGLVSNFALFNP
jgi:hypothetical protein